MTPYAASSSRRRRRWAVSPRACRCRPASSFPSEPLRRRGRVAEAGLTLSMNDRKTPARAAQEPLSSFDGLVAGLRSLPGVGPKAAQRMALHLLQHDRDGAIRLAHALQHAATTVRHCDRCNTFTEDVLCSFCRSGKRDPALLCIVETPADLMMVEQT